MTSLARRSLLQLSRQSPKLHRSLPITSRRLLSISPLRRQTALETPAVEEVATAGLNDAPVFLEDDITQVDWSRSFHGLSTEPFSEEAAKILTAPLVLDDIEIKPGPSPTHSPSTLLVVGTNGRWHNISPRDKVPSDPE